MKEVIQNLAQSALQSGTISLLDVIKVLKSDTMTEAEHVLEKGLEAMQQQAAVQQEAEQQAAQAEQEKQNQEFEHETNLKNIDAQSRIESAEISAEAQKDVAIIHSRQARDVSDVGHRVNMDLEYLRSTNEKQEETPKKEVPKK